MTRDDILATIRASDAELRKLQVRELALFGSFAGGEQTENSDIDFYVECDRKTFDNYMGLRRLHCANPVTASSRTAVTH
jgi:predicted nucleotidyltransferase